MSSGSKSYFLLKESEPLKTDAEQVGVQLLWRLRDKAHRFVVSFQS